MRHFIIIAIFLNSLNIFAGYDDFSTGGNDILFDISQFKFSSSRELFEKTNIDTTNGSEGFYILSYYYIIMGEDKKAEEYLYKANLTSKEECFSNFLKGRIEYSNDNLELSYEYFNRALSLKPNFELAFVGVITIYLYKEQIKEAEDVIDDFLKRNPGSGEALYLKGLIMLRKEKYEKSLEYFDRVVHVTSFINKSDLYASIGNAELNLNNFEKAEKLFNQALEINQSSSVAWHGKGLTAYRAGLFDEALVAFNTELQIIYQHKANYRYLKKAYYNLGMTYLRLDNPLEACKSFHNGCQRGNKNACFMVVVKCQKGSELEK